MKIKKSAKSARVEIKSQGLKVRTEIKAGATIVEKGGGGSGGRGGSGG